MNNITSHDIQSLQSSEDHPAWIAARTKHFCLLTTLILGLLWSAAFHANAAGGGENMLLVVNSSDEPSLRIANAYIKARNIPVNNVLYIAGGGISVSPASFVSVYQNPISNAIAARGLINQIDYIGTIGLPHYISGNYVTATSTSSYVVAVNNCLNHLTQLQNGMSTYNVVGRYSELIQDTPDYNATTYSYTPGSNKAIYHSQKWTPVGSSGTATTVQWYMSGNIGYAGVRGLTTSQAIESLQRTVKGDGTNPQGTIYFEDSQEIRTTTRSPFWPAIQSYLDDVGVPWIQEKSITPKNRSDVRGAVVGSASPTVATQIVNGSAFLPGSWADDLTSFGGNYGVGSSQTVVSNLLLAGAAGAAGTVNEPYAIQSRFTYASIFVFSNDGSTLGEAYYKSLEQPDLLMFQGDILSQPYADIPEVKFSGGPADGDTVSGIISVSGSARLNNPRIATAVAQMKLFVDGLQTGPVVTGSSGSFTLDTTALTDGIHEVRIVAYNNSQAASEGYTLKNLVVNNKSQTVSIAGTNNYNIAWNQTLSIPVSATQGSGPAITAIQLQSLGRVVGSISSASGTIALSGSSLTYGSNTITPVAILSSSTQKVQGMPITVTRQLQQFPGKPPTPLSRRNPGADFSFFGSVGSTLDTTNYNATPAYAFHSTSISMSPGDTYRPSTRNYPDVYRTGNNAYKVAVLIKSNFTIDTAGEYLFTPANGAYSSFGLYVDGTIVTRYDKWNSTTSVWDLVDSPRGIYLLPGEHTLVVKLGQTRGGRTDYESTFSLCVRGPDGNTNWAGAPTFYTVSKRLGP